MRSTHFAFAAFVALAHAACSGDASSTSEPSPPLPSNGSDTTPPPKDLQNGHASTGTPSTGTPGAATGDHSVPVGGTPVGTDNGSSGSSSGGSSSGGSSSGGSSSGSTPPPPPPDPNAGAGSAPTAACTVTKDSAGFFVRSSALSSYVAYVPASYSPTAPMRLIVGVHGCGDSAMNFATWGVNPYDTRTTQQHIGISIGGRDGACWTAADDAKVLAAVADISSCFWVHQKKIVLAGYSSGGELTYRLGLSQSPHFAGLLIEDSGLYAANGDPNSLLTGASWKLNIAHLHHTSDTTFPLATVQADWTKTLAAGFPLVTKTTAGTHDGTSTDWATWLIPQSAGWTAP